ncbi:MAG: DarT ssDNA thymidine ADP-ribosyltransferase family protein [Steroidobacteraceae bacterium]
MPNIQDQKLLYHLTKLDNIPSILDRGLMPRAQINDFKDVADPEIITNRRQLGLDAFVPFHWFARNPFDGRVQEDHPDAYFILITVRRALAQRENWLAVSSHPLANSTPQLLTYEKGFAEIDWETMNRRDYHDTTCKNVCMAECLSPRVVPASDFFQIYAPNEMVAMSVRQGVAQRRLQLDVGVNGAMFLR